MILSGEEIRDNDDIVIEPFDESRLNPNSYNLRLDDTLLVYDTTIADPRKDNPTREVTIPEDGLVLEPDDFCLGQTVEYTETYNHAPMLDGRSSIGRLGLSVHETAGFGDVGFKGYWTLEIATSMTTVLYPKMEICQIYYHPIKGEYEDYNSDKYQDNDGVQKSLLYKELR